MRKFLLTLMMCILVINIVLPIYADDELDENNITEAELHEIIETATNATNTPIINSRYAIIYDRTSRRNTLWERRR